MTDSPDVLSTKLTLSMGATIAVNTGREFDDWVKPAAEYSIKWNGIPTEEQVRLATTFIQREILNPILEDVVASAQARIIEARKE